MTCALAKCRQKHSLFGQLGGIAERFQNKFFCNRGGIMPAKVIQLRPGRQTIAQYVRVGRSHRQLESLLAAGRLPIERAVFDAALVTHQQDLIEALRSAGRETVLDTNVAELSAIGRFQGSARQAPWSEATRPLEARDIQHPNFSKAIARFALQHGFGAVLAPTHFLTNAEDPWLDVDITTCVRLRRALDAAGGSDVGLDYVLSVPNRVMRDPLQRQTLLAKLTMLPFENLWFRISQFGADATGAGVRRYIESLQEFLILNRPVVADNVAGLAAMATVAFGVAGGVAHGVGDAERFDASNWNKPPKEGGFNRVARILVPALDRQLSKGQVSAIVAATGGRRLIACSECCRRGLDDMWGSPKAHYLYTRRRQIQGIAAVPDLRRSYHFVQHDIADADRNARALARLKMGDLPTKQMIQKESGRLERFFHIMDDLNSTGSFDVRSGAPRFRSQSGPPGRRARS